ncbi:serine/threonine-protein kinase SRPK3 [Colletotrichum truncatum]|uniref:Serine/threonine-protein kinase SRPK3 n=1 Tax=Colletotrichum truncatum TaxID=5467 RepID=A0ACC3Z837_COLTU|nr:serine/threonine-protein kinase SRPK3 [Colletotrichum truncatum]KAF6783674.1 serine/threonine-protein kinase SRPK3 [Colletotrichum truncatum]
MSSPPLTPPSKDPTSERNYRFQQTGTPCEWAESYRPGGFHPVHLGDIFNGRYEAIRKLGNGSFGTVWLAHDGAASRYVALKIEVSTRRKPNELGIQQLLAKRASEDPGSRHVVNLLDSFYQDGPNGSHLCLVFEPMGPSLSSVLNAPVEIYDPLNPPVRRFEMAKTKRILRQVLLGLRFLHDSGVVHGDLQSGNVLFALQDLSRFGREALKQKTDKSRIDPVQRIDGKLDKWAPRYLVVSEPLSEYALSGSDEVVKLSDLGEDRRYSGIITSPGNDSEKKSIGTGIDTWSFGCLVFELITGVALFQIPPFGLSDEAVKDTHLIQMTDILGPLPDDLLENWPARSKYYGPEGERLDARPRDFDEDESDGDDVSDHEDIEEEFDDEEDFDFDMGNRGPPMVYDSLEKLINTHKPAGVNDEEEKQIIGLLRSIFHYNSDKRPSVAVLLQNCWINS